MIKKFSQFIREFVESSILDVKMQELKELIDSYDYEYLIYEWENINDHELYINFSTNNITLRYEFDIDNLLLTRISNGSVDYEQSVSSIDEGLHIIEKDIHSILGISEKIKTPGEKYKGHHIPKKYLTRKKGAMKKEIETFRGKDKYKKKWVADIDYRTGKRIKTKKSASTKAYQKMFGDKK